MRDGVLTQSHLLLQVLLLSTSEHAYLGRIDHHSHRDGLSVRSCGGVGKGDNRSGEVGYHGSSEHKLDGQTIRIVSKGERLKRREGCGRTGRQNQCLEAFRVGRPSVGVPAHISKDSLIALYRVNGHILDAVTVILSVRPRTSGKVESWVARSEECLGVVEGHREDNDSIRVHVASGQRVDGHGHSTFGLLGVHLQLGCEGVELSVHKVRVRLSRQGIRLSSGCHQHVHIHLISTEHVVFEQVITREVHGCI